MLLSSSPRSWLRPVSTLNQASRYSFVAVKISRCSGSSSGFRSNSGTKFRSSPNAASSKPRSSDISSICFCSTLASSSMLRASSDFPSFKRLDASCFFCVNFCLNSRSFFVIATVIRISSLNLDIKNRPKLSGLKVQAPFLIFQLEQHAFLLTAPL
ncbi:hypothetical protein B4145_4692 [Bacillus subtilis]|uniref:Uncharacterized protein n=1 Tax=Bacillus subtilis subsp. subtilis TaxID=135461 RepID=A0ABD3ZSQ4_BACIU|nr:hypothetical protein B4067_4779 [Bacillus subtilis subsp. subtilis]KIN47953.1 hypothetical protein B4145_4692 [Bacillus subtilis]